MSCELKTHEFEFKLSTRPMSGEEGSMLALLNRRWPNFKTILSSILTFIRLCLIPVSIKIRVVVPNSFQ